jgi:hypothetical protein
MRMRAPGKNLSKLDIPAERKNLIKPEILPPQICGRPYPQLFVGCLLQTANTHSVRI